MTTPLRSGFVTLVGRPNAGKSTLLNALVGRRVSIVSDKPQTTRFPIRGVLNRPGMQAVLVDTPGIHKPRTKLGERLNSLAHDSLDVDAVCFVIDATATIGRGDASILAQLDPARTVLALSKIDRASREQIASQLAIAAEWGLAAYVPVSGRTRAGVPVLVDELLKLLPEGPEYYPPGQLSDLSESVWVAELVREQLLRVARDELPHSIFTRVIEWVGMRIVVEIIVERESQKGIVIGVGGAVLKRVGTEARRRLPEGTFLELKVRVDRDWQRRPDALDRLFAEPD